MLTYLNIDHITYLNQRKDGHPCVRLSTVFIALSLKIMNGVCFYEILILIKTKNINVCCFQVITNQTNHDYLSISRTPII